MANMVQIEWETASLFRPLVERVEWVMGLGPIAPATPRNPRRDVDRGKETVKHVSLSDFRRVVFPT